MELWNTTVQLTTSKIGNLTRLIHTLLFVMTIHTYIHTYILYILLYSSMYLLITVCCFHLTSVASNAVGLYMIPRNRKGFFLSQSTLRENFVEKKFQVFDIVGPLIILVQVDLSSPVERV